MLTNYLIDNNGAIFRNLYKSHHFISIINV
jgi:hypothetical protein